ncbi:SCO family protein [Sphingomonas sp.]|jgi:protein SCO1/2|uniref:SCO family protein n=1 Tax=Sphingomonas sp. TaxID=28214 RepID=UPI0035C7F68B
MNLRLLPFLAAAALLAACSPTAPTPEEPPLAGARIGGPFALVDEDGRPRTDRDFAGRWRVMYFGYTFCPDVCPVDMQNLGAGLKALEKAAPQTAAKVTPVFVTVDPERDTPKVLKEFTAAFHPRMVGLTGTPQAIAAAADAYGVPFSKGETSPGGGYLVSHGRYAYLMGPDGKPVALVPTDQSPQAVAETLAKWVK